MSKEFLQKALYELLYNNLLLPRTHEIDREEESMAFDGTTGSLVQLHKEHQITFEQFLKLPEAEIQRIITKSKDLPIDKERFFALCDMYWRYVIYSGLYCMYMLINSYFYNSIKKKQE